jgi:hypothetical protein
VPDWYPLIRAAKYLGVAPWDLAERPAHWMHLALAAEGAELGASEQRAKLAQKRGGQRR